MKKNKKLLDAIEKHEGKIVRFKDLCKEEQYALAWYMSIDGEAWDQPPKMVFEENEGDMKKVFMKNIGWYVKKYGNHKIGHVELPTVTIQTLIVENIARIKKTTKENVTSSFNPLMGFDGEVFEKRRELWPVILDLQYDNYDIAVLQDGWHRFHDYVVMGLKHTNCLYWEN